jgi:hypothetical protein
MSGGNAGIRLATAAVVLLALAGGCQRPAPDPVPAPPTASPSVAAPPPTVAPLNGVDRGRHPGFPSGTVSWRTDAPPLPIDRGVGPASMLLLNDDGAHLLMPDGAQWTLPERAYPTLSPNGRWLGYNAEQGYVLRDLTGTEIRPLPEFSDIRPAGWSPGGRWVVGQNVRGDVPVVDLRTGARWLLDQDVRSDGEPLDSGVIAERNCSAPEQLRVHLLDPSDVGHPTTLTFDATPHLRTGEQAVQEPYYPDEEHSPQCLFRVAPHDQGYLRVVTTPPGHPDWRECATVPSFLVISLRTGDLVRRVDLWRPLRCGTDSVLGTVGETLLVKHITDGRGDDNRNACELWQVDMRTGAVHNLARFSGGFTLNVPAPGDPG